MPNSLIETNVVSGKRSRIRSGSASGSAAGVRQLASSSALPRNSGSRASAPSAVVTSSATLRLPALSSRCSPPPSTSGRSSLKGPAWRIASPPGGSMRITSAPLCASSRPQ